MGLADTARLIASLELQDKFSKTASSFDRTVGGLERRVGTFGRIGNEVGRGLGAAASNLRTIGLVGAGVIAASVTSGVRSLARLEEVTAATNAVLLSTGNVAGVTGEKIRVLAEKYENLNATMDDKVIQSAENLLLTFTNITDKAFEPALEAALNMNQAMGGGEEGLQQTIIQLGKALQDPVRGATALRKVGVNLTAQQQAQIKVLVEQNKLYEAQQLILKELGTEFGGQFAAAGTTATAKFGKLQDAVEEAQQAMARGFLPVLGKVADKVNVLLADPAVLGRIEGFGDELAGAFDDIVGFAGNVPWGAIGTSLELAGTGAKAVLGFFKEMPPWVQTAVISGWGLNKLTGGMFTGIIGELGKGIIKGVMGMNAGVVNINAAVVNGGLPIQGGGPGTIGTLLRALPALFGPTAAAATAGFFSHQNRIEGNAALGLRSDQSIFDAWAEGLNQDAADALASATPFGQFLRGNFGGTPFKKGTFGAGKGGVMLPDTAMSLFGAGGTALPDTAMSAWSTTATEAKKLAPILNRQDQKTQLVAQRVAELRNATTAGLSNLGGIVRTGLQPVIHVHVNMPPAQINLSQIERRLASSRVARGGNSLDLGGGF